VDDGTLVVVSGSTELGIDLLQDADDQPVLRLSLEHGEIHVIEGVATSPAIDGAGLNPVKVELYIGELEARIARTRKGEDLSDLLSAYKIAFDPGGGDLSITCLDGSCSFASGPVTFEIRRGGKFLGTIFGGPIIGTLTEVSRSGIGEDDFRSWLATLDFADVDPASFPLIRPCSAPGPIPYPYKECAEGQQYTYPQQPLPTEGEGGHVERSTNDVQIGQPGNLHAATEGETLQVGEKIITGHGSAAVFELIDGTQLIINEDSELQLVSLDLASADPTLRLRLEHGQVFAVKVKQKVWEAPPSLLQIEWGGETGGDTPLSSIRSAPPKSNNPYRNFTFSLAYDPVSGNGQASCLQGECTLQEQSETFDLKEGQVLEARAQPKKWTGPTLASRSIVAGWLGALDYAAVDAALFTALQPGGEGDPSPYPVIAPEGDPSPYPFTLAYRNATVHKITGDAVDLLTAVWADGGGYTADANAAPLSEGQVLIHGQSVRTGPGSGVILELDDGTLVVLNEDTVLDLNELGGTLEAPRLDFGLERGEIFIFHEPTLHEGARSQITLADGVVVEMQNGSEHGHLGLNLAYYADSDDFVITVLGGQAHVTDGEQTADLTTGGHLHGRVKVRLPWLSEASLTEHDASLWLWALDFAEKDQGDYSSLKDFEETEHTSSPSLEPHYEEEPH
jgi:hypothetical protein